MLGTFLRAFTFGHVRQLDAVASCLLAELARRTPLLPGADAAAYVDIDDTVRATHGYAKQVARRGGREPEAVVSAAQEVSQADPVRRTACRRPRAAGTPRVSSPPRPGIGD